MATPGEAELERRLKELRSSPGYQAMTAEEATRGLVALGDSPEWQAKRARAEAEAALVAELGAEEAARVRRRQHEEEARTRELVAAADRGAAEAKAAEEDRARRGVFFQKRTPSA